MQNNRKNLSSCSVKCFAVIYKWDSMEEVARVADVMAGGLRIEFFKISKIFML